MPLIDIQFALSGLDSGTLEQAGIIANFLAGILLASEYFLINDKIDKINNYLGLQISKAYNNFSRRIKVYAKWNRWLILTILFVVISLSVYQTLFYSASSLWDYITYYYGLTKLILIPMRRVLLASLSILAVMFIILFIARSTPKKMIGAFAILLFTVGNMLLFLSTLFE
jgi:predicted anti-sigma-YlaC factor YlaD